MIKAELIKNDGIALASISLLFFATPGCYKTQENQLNDKEAGAGETILFVHGVQEDTGLLCPRLMR